MSRSKKIKHIRKKRIQKRKHKTRKNGGFWPFTKSKDNDQPIPLKDPKSCPGANMKCDFFDQEITGKKNQTWKTCINMNEINNQINYITPTNVIIKSVETAQIPEFSVKLKDGQEAQCRLTIEGKFINCFLNVCGDWYAMMRLFGSTLNTGYLARTEGNKVFYKLKNITIDNDSLIIIPGDKYSEVSNSYFFALTSFSNKSGSTKAIELSSDCFLNINKSNDLNTFKVLQRFRQQKLFANDAKQELAERK